MSAYETKPDSIVFTAGCAPLCHYYNYEKITRLECGNKIIMPQRMLDRLSKYENLTYPLTFEIISDKNKYICGVYEFVFGIDHIYVPHFIYDKIQCDIAAIRYIDTPFKNGTKVIIADDGLAGFGGVTSPAHQVDIQSSGTGSSAKIPLKVKQADDATSIMKIEGKAVSGNITKSIVVDSSAVTRADIKGYMKVKIEDTGNQLPDGDYYIPLYTLS